MLDRSILPQRQVPSLGTLTHLSPASLMKCTIRLLVQAMTDTIKQKAIIFFLLFFLQAACVLYNVAEIKALHLVNGFASISVYDNVTTVKTRAASKLNTLSDCINW